MTNEELEILKEILTELKTLRQDIKKLDEIREAINSVEATIKIFSFH